MTDKPGSKRQPPAQPPVPHDTTIPSRATQTQQRRVATPNAASPGQPTAVIAPRPLVQESNRIAPGLIQQALMGDIDLEAEMLTRYPQIPVMSLMHTRAVGTRLVRALAQISTQDGAAGLLIEVDPASKLTHFTFTSGSMLGLRFTPARLTDMDRAFWLDGMRRAGGAPGEHVFLWSASRWEYDYLVCAPRRHHTSIFAYSPGAAAHLEAAARLTRDVTAKLTDWLAQYWG